MAIDLTKDGMSIGASIRSIRVHTFDMSQEDFAEKMSVNINTLRNWEQGICEPPAYFMAYLKSEEERLKADYVTPVSRIRSEFANDRINNEQRRKIGDYAASLISKDSKQEKVAKLIKETLKKDGILENLQRVSPYFDEYTPTDIAILSQTILLGEISRKLDVIIESISK